MFNLLKMAGVLVGMALMSIGAVWAFVYGIIALGFTPEATVLWRPAPIDMFIAMAGPITIGLMAGVIGLMAVWVYELKKAR
jgi:hypothetical protein